jgi:hypothetical protein
MNLMLNIDNHRLKTTACRLLVRSAVATIVFCVAFPVYSQQRPIKSTRAKPPRNVLHLPKVDVSEDRGNIAPKRLPSTATPMRLSSSVMVDDSDDLLLPEEDQPADVPSSDDTKEKFEAVTPVPIQPNDQFDAEWVKRNGGERLPPKRQLYPLNESDPNKDHVPSAPLNGTPKDTPNNDLLDVPRQSENAGDKLGDEAAPLRLDSGHQSDLLSEPAANTYGNQTTAFPRLMPTLADRLNYVQHNLNQNHVEVIQGAPVSPQFDTIQQGQTTFPRRFDGTSPSGPVASNPVVPPLPSGYLNQRVNDRLLWSQEPASMYAQSGPPANSDYHPEDFAPVMVRETPQNLEQDLKTYYGKQFVPTQRPLVELWRPFYGDGIFSPAIPVFSDVNPLSPQFLVYGDYRSGVGVHRNNGQPVRSIANRLALEMDLRLTGTERFHALMAPLDHNGRFTRLDFSDSSDVSFQREMDAQLDTGFFEGDLGAIVGGMMGEDAPFDLPIAAGLMPMLYQNGIWMEDIVAGVAVSLPWRHSTTLNWANYDATFFALFDQITSPAFLNQNSAANAFGTAWFIEAYDGYIEADYAYMLDTVDSNRSYHNSALAYTRRYFDRVSNSIRVINNVGQGDSPVDRTADGTLLLIENSLITSQATTVIPYANFFYGVRRTQSVARAAAAGGILRNTGILFESDNLTGYPTLDATGNNAYGGAFGLNLFASNFRRQLVMEFAALDTYGDAVFSKSAGPQYGIGGRYQHALTNWTLLRFDAMVGWRENDSNIYGTRAEWRWKF